LEDIRGVESVGYISKEEAAKIFEQEVGESFEDILDSNPLPASFRLRIRDGYNNADSVEVIAAKARHIWTVDQVVYRKQFLNLIDKRARAFQFATLFIGIVLAVSAIVLVANTIKLTIYAKRETIRTMKFVGATPMFIRMPFLLEGLFHGLIGGIFASILIFVAFMFFIRPLSDDLLIHINLNAIFFFFLILMGGMLGLLGSILSVGHFLRETIVTE
jgi:cell division transport system permease protein